MQIFCGIRNKIAFKKQINFQKLSSLRYTLLCYTNSGVIYILLKGESMDLSKIYNKIEADNIKVFPFGVDKLKAVTIETENKYGIFVNHKEIEDANDEFCVLAHEYGHCASGTTHKLNSPYDLIERHEYRADRQSILEFLPIEMMQKALNKGCIHTYEFAEYLDIPEDFVRLAFKHYKAMEMI